MPSTYISSTSDVVTSATADPFNISHTISSGTDTALVVSAGVHRSGRIMSSVTLDETGLNLALTKFAFAVESYEASIWYLINPPVGTFNLRLIPSGNSRMAGTVIDFSGVDQTTPLENAQSVTSTSATSLVTPSITTGVDDITVGRFFTNASATNLVAGLNQTELQNANAGAGYGGCSYADPGKPLMRWDWDNNRLCGLLGVSVKAAAGGGGGGADVRRHIIQAYKRINA